jgi:hypothetical protein
MSGGTCTRVLCGTEVELRIEGLQNCWKVVTFDPELGIEHGYSRWKYIENKNKYMKSNWRKEVNEKSKF